VTTPTEIQLAILDELIDASTGREFLPQAVLDEWWANGPPSLDAISGAIAELERRGFLEEALVSYEGEQFAVLKLSAGGRAFWREHNPLAERLSSAWRVEWREAGPGSVVYAPNEDIANAAARELHNAPFGLFDIDLSHKTVVPATYELEDTGDVIAGVRVEYSKRRWFASVLSGIYGSWVSWRLNRLLRRRRRQHA
jgi:hypothetical protein